MMQKSLAVGTVGAADETIDPRARLANVLLETMRQIEQQRLRDMRVRFDSEGATGNVK